MAIEHWFTIVCENLLLSKDEKFTLVNILGNIAVDDFPARIPHLIIAVGLIGKAGEKYTVEFMGPEEKGIKILEHTLTSEQLEITDKGPHGKTVAFNDLYNLELKSPGTYKIIMKQGKKIVHTYSFEVMRRSSGVAKNDLGADQGHEP